MKHLLLLLASSLLLPSSALSQELIVHEWGTFTTVQGSDGTLLPGLYIEEEHLPDFVYHHGGVSPDPTVSQKGRYRPMENVTVKMETPVLYFYRNQESGQLLGEEGGSVSVRVDFTRGSISQWYPQRSAGESDDGLSTIDFAAPYNGWIEWNAKVLPSTSDARPSPPRDKETAVWTAPRATDANLVQGENGEVEKFLFYRGLGNFPVPVRILFNDRGELVLTNTGSEAIPYFFVYDKPEGQSAGVWWSGGLEAGESRIVQKPLTFVGEDDLALKFTEFEDALVGAGLYRKEAAAMLDTWSHSYFGMSGLRVFWIVPRSFTEEILPIKIIPPPAELERVLVGRSEIITPKLEKELVDDATANNWIKWESDRYHLAYRARAQQIMALSSAEFDRAVSNREKGLKIYPNPGEKVYTIKAEIGGNPSVKLTVTNTLGEQIIVREDLARQGIYRSEIDLGDLPAGLYVIALQSEDQLLVQRVVKK